MHSNSRNPLPKEQRRLDASDFHPRILQLFDAYVHGAIDREGFVSRAHAVVYPNEEDRARELFARLDRVKTLKDFIAAAGLLLQYPEANGRLGAVGFCYGGGVVHELAGRLPELGAAVPFYGSAPSPERARHVRTALQVHLAATDERINSTWPAHETALRAAGAAYEVYPYPGTQHGFHNETTPRYDPAAAELAWRRTLDLLRRRSDTDESSAATV